MNIVTRTSMRGIIYVFLFEDEGDRDYWFNTWEKCANRSPFDGAAGDLKEMVSRLRNRTDDKYPRKGYKLSGMLFPSEFLRFASATTFLMCVFESVIDEKLFEELVKQIKESESESLVDESEDEYDENEFIDDVLPDSKDDFLECDEGEFLDCSLSDSEDEFLENDAVSSDEE